MRARREATEQAAAAGKVAGAAPRVCKVAQQRGPRPCGAEGRVEAESVQVRGGRATARAPRGCASEQSSSEVRSQ